MCREKPGDYLPLKRRVVSLDGMFLTSCQYWPDLVYFFIDTSEDESSIL
jgi:hypothetical protein